MRWIGLTTLAFATALAVVYFRVLDHFSYAGEIPRDVAAQSLAVYWALSCLVIALVIHWRTHRMQILLALVSLGFALGVFEVAARVLEVPQGFLRLQGLASRTNHHLYAPNRIMYAGAYEGEQVLVTTNEDGLRSLYGRDDYRAFEKRIAILGDSFTFGFGVQQEDTVPTLLESALREKLETENLAVLNAGIVSYAPLLEKLLFDDIVRHYEPELVILMLDPTDIGDDLRYSLEAVEEGGRTVFPRAGPECGETGAANYYGAVSEILASALAPLEIPLLYPFQAIGQRLGFSVGKDCAYNYYDFNLEIGGVLETNRYFHYRHPLELTRSYFDASLSNIKTIAKAVRATGADFLLVISPRFHHWNPKESPDNWETDDYELDEPYQFEYFRYFDQARSRVDFPIFDLLPAFQATDEYPLVFRTDPHWNSRGSEFVARVLANHLATDDRLKGL